MTVDIGSRLELMADDELIEHMNGVSMQLQTPREMPAGDNPFPEGAYATVIKDKDIYRAYYRSVVPGYDGPRHDGHKGETTCYAESSDGINWEKPELGLIDVNGSRANNVILKQPAFSHNFSPFLDTRPAKDRGKRFKALAGTHPGGLYAFESEDGIHWNKMLETPVMTSEIYAFDSQNVSFWSEIENCYVCYFRHTPKDAPRTISRAVSQDFLNWEKPVATKPNLPGEHLYTSQTHPYFRAAHIYIALPTRFQANRGATTDIMFMTARAGSTSFSRLFKEAFIRPGLDPERWGNRSNYVALNVVPTGPAEMSIYHCKNGKRYTLRTDGFASAHAGFDAGELITKPLKFSGSDLILNYSTSAAGSMQVEIQDKQGAPVPGFGLADCAEIIGDELERRVEWNNQADLKALQGQPVKLRFVMKECDLYSFRFK